MIKALSIVSVLTLAFLNSNAIAEESEMDVTVIKSGCMNLSSSFDRKAQKIVEKFGCDITASNGDRKFLIRYTGEERIRTGTVLTIPSNVTDDDIILLTD